MEKPAKHRFLNNALFTALIVPLAFFCPARYYRRFDRDDV